MAIVFIKIDISLQATLDDLKHQISKLKSIEPKFQRVFHLGREIKNSRRSLHALGIGRYGAFVVHLHSSKPKVIELASEKKSVAAAAATVAAATAATTSSHVDTGASRNNGNINRGRKRNRSAASASGRTGRNNHVNVQSSSSVEASGTIEVIDIADSDDSDDEVIEVIEIDKRSRRR